MNQSNIRIITIMASLALIGLIAIQIYWVNSAIALGEERFEQSVNEALNNVVKRMEKKEAAVKVTRKFNFRKQGMRFFGPSKAASLIKDTMCDDKQCYDLKKNNVNVKIVEDFASDSNGVITKRTRQKDYSSDTMSTLMEQKIGNDGPTFFQQLETSQNWLSKKSDMMNDIFDELVSINVYNGYGGKLDTMLLDSILKDRKSVV